MNKKHTFTCWACHYEGLEDQKNLHISESYLRVNSVGQLVLVCKDHKDDLIDPNVVRKFRKMFNLKKNDKI